jgi:glycosyltransferase involved in cell wall biosynthesis
MVLRKKTKKALMVFVEPTPYLLPFIDALVRKVGDADVVFLKENSTQDWNITLPPQYLILDNRFKRIRFLASLVLSRRYGLIHVAGWSHPVCLSLILFSRFIGTPLVVESDSQLNINLPFLKKLVKRPLYFLLFKLPKAFLPGGTRQAAYFRHYGVKPGKLVLAQMTVDVQAIQRQVQRISCVERSRMRAKYAVVEKDIVFLFVGRLLDWKGLKELMTAFSALDCLRAKLWVVGDGDLRQYVSTCARDDERIVYHGRVSGQALVHLYHAADVFVLASHFEPWGLVVNEAMAAGLPVLASDNVGSVDDLVFHGKTGMIAKARNIESLRLMMQFMLNESEKRIAMGQRAAEHITKWTVDNSASNAIAAWKMASKHKRVDW